MPKFWAGRGEKPRSPVVSGFYYPETKTEVLKSLSAYGMNGQPGNASAVLAPHGSWKLSGMAAAAAIRALKTEGIKRVVILSHLHELMPDTERQQLERVFLTESDSFITPLGKLFVDKDSIEELSFYSTLIEINDIPHLRDHSIEVLLPMVKYCFPRALIVPILVDKITPRCINALARVFEMALKPLQPETVFIISSCLSLNQNRDTAIAQAEHFTNIILGKNNKIEELQKASAEEKISCCGGLLTAVLYESGILDGLQARTLLRKLLLSRGNNGEAGTVCYDSIAFE
jgi:AmmeMemoRadiSam system protein B